MADKDKDPATEGMVSTDEGTATNRSVGDSGDGDDGGQTPDQFFTGARDDDGKVDKSHATKGMLHLGYTEASRLENTAAQQEQEREAAERAAKRSKKED